jgi:ABC-type dipeptide/oligopeptide/nickel transport system permease component
MAMESHDLDPMFFFTVSMGVVTFLMAWIIAVIAIKGAAARRGNKSMDRLATNGDYHTVA